MKINGEFVLREVVGEYIVIPTGRTALTMNGMITLDPVGALIWQELTEGSEPSSVLAKILDRFDVDEATARADMEEFIEKLRASGLIEE